MTTVGTIVQEPFDFGNYGSHIFVEVVNDFYHPDTNRKFEVLCTVCVYMNTHNNEVFVNVAKMLGRRKADGWWYGNKLSQAEAETRHAFGTFPLYDFRHLLRIFPASHLFSDFSKHNVIELRQNT